MKTIISLFFVNLLVLISYSQSYISLNSNKSKTELIQSSENSIRFTNDIEGFFIKEHKTKDGNYLKLNIPSYLPNKDIGSPELPIKTKLIELPENAKPVINIISYSEEVIDLNNIGINLSIMPNQLSLFKNQNPDDVKFEKNSEIYSQKSYYSTELVEVNYLGKMRGVNIHQLIISPFEYDISSNTLIIRNNIEVEILFKGGDISKTNQLKTNNYSPAFKNIYGKIWNYSNPTTKDELSKFPIKYVIVSDPMFKESLEDFVLWKTQKGFHVIEAYTDEIGNTTDEIKTYLQGLYENGTANDPAPSYVLFVGDVDQVPAFEVGSGWSGHVSDMYYCEYDGDGDYIPEVYYGRFSAQNVEQLLPQIEKTIMFEKFTFPNSDFINETVLVAGDDSNWAPTHGNGQVNYAKEYYFNDDIGVIDHTYLHPESNSQAASIIADISNGVGFVNYTAHCSSSGWAGPNFTTSNVPNLENEDKYFFSVGNCCQSNKFEEDECFGESLLRADKKGAVIHIGGSNNTMWDEDFYWSVGVTGNVTANPTYDETTNAYYDHLFHFNDEDPYTTASQIVFIGNMQVLNSSSSQKQYYWEIYHVMGDPSVMPYVGNTPEIEANYLSSIPLGMSTLNVNTEAGALVALSMNGNLLDSKIADESGLASLVFDPLNDVGDADIVVSKQFRAPHIESIMVVPNDSEYDAMLRSIDNPTSLLHISNASFNPTFTIMNLGQEILTSVTVGYYINQDNPIEIEWEGNLETLESEVIDFSEISLNDGAYTITAYVSNPNNEEDEFPSNDIVTKNFTVYSGKVTITNIIEPDNNICNQTGFEPTFEIKNLDNYPLTSLTCSYFENSNETSIVWEGNVEPNQTEIISFDFSDFSEGNNTISYEISNPNNGTNTNSVNTSVSKDYFLSYEGTSVMLDLLTDTYASENSWELINIETNEVVDSGGSYPDNAEANYYYNWCLPKGCYSFTINDSYGDGMSGSMWGGSPGHITITNLENDEIILDLQGDDFESSFNIEFCLNYTLCPNDTTVTDNDQAFSLATGGFSNGIFSGAGVDNNSFDPSIAGIGSHTITYTIDEDGTEVSCTFKIDVLEYNLTNSDYFDDLHIFPNPTNGILYIEYHKPISVKIINAVGQIIKTQEFYNGKTQFNLSNYPNGTYFIQISDNQNITYRKISLIK